MSAPISDLSVLLSTLQPKLNEGVYVFMSVPAATDLTGVAAIATFREAEGVTVVVEERAAAGLSFPILMRAAWITLTVHSDLHAVGLTGAFAQALAEANISCNVIAAAYHDHIFVPVESAASALSRLQALQHTAAADSQAD